MQIATRLIFKLTVAMFCATLLNACALVELSGKITRKAGEAMTDYSKENDGVIGKMAGVGGNVYTAVGGTVEDAAKSGKEGEAPRPPGKQAAAQGAGSGAAGPTGPAQPTATVATSGAPGGNAIAQVSVALSDRMSIGEAQKRLAELGYQPGPADGESGKRTIDALKKYQKDNKLLVSGVLDAETIVRLRGTQNGK